MKCLLLLLLSLFLCLFLSSCGVLKKLRNKSEVTVITKIDTVIIIKKDTVPKIVKVTLHDTAFVENTVASAKSYFDTTLQKIVLSLKGKVFIVPVKESKITITKADIKTVDRKPNYIGWSSLFFLSIVILYLIIMIYRLLKKYKIL